MPDVAAGLAFGAMFLAAWCARRLYEQARARGLFGKK